MIDRMLGGVLEKGTQPDGTGDLEVSGEVAEAEDRDSETGKRSRRRFTGAAIVGMIVAGVPYFWILTNDWSGTYNPGRRISFLSGFYDNQAQSIIHGHLWVPTGSLGFEGFVHDGRTYTYFGLLLSFLRIPFIVLAPQLAGRLTATSMLTAWLLTGLFSSLLIWRIRILLRGDSALGWAEAVSFGVMTAAILGGSVLLFLASEPWVYDEDIAWTVPITIATLFVFAGILDRPSRGQVIAAGALILAGALERPSPAWACAVGAILIAGWFYRGHGGAERKRWAFPMVVAGLVPLAAWSFVNWLKFGTFLNGLPLIDQVWTQVNAHRRAFLAVTGGKGYSFHFLPTTAWAYLQPFGIRAQPTFPFLSLPIGSPHVFGGYVVDILYPTASVPASMPLLFLLSCWALLASFRPRAARGLMLMRIPLIAAAGTTTVDYFLGYIAPRYLGDFLPFLVLGGAIGLVDLWRRWESRRRAAKGAALALVIALALLSVVANVGLALTPTTEWSRTQASNYLRTVKAVSDITGHPLAKQIERGSVLPYMAPAGEVFVAGDCAGLYLASGKPVSADPTLQLEHRSWLPVEQGPGIYNKILVTFNTSPSRLGAGVPLLTVGRDTVLIRSAGHQGVRFVLDDPRYPMTGKTIQPKLGHTYHLLVETDPFLKRIIVNMGERAALSGVLSGAGSRIQPVTVNALPAADSDAHSPLTVVHQAFQPNSMTLCRSLLNDQ